MFTGIVEEVGYIARIDQNGENRRIVIEAKTVTKELRTGDSCAVSALLSQEWRWRAPLCC